MKFKTSLLATEFYGANLDARLRAVILELDLQAARKFAQELTITCVLRTPEEQAAFYPKNPKKPSRHLDRPSRAVDFRSLGLGSEVIDFLQAHVKVWWPEFDFLINDRGAANPHIHVEIDSIPTNKSKEVEA